MNRFGLRSAGLIAALVAGICAGLVACSSETPSSTPTPAEPTSASADTVSPSPSAEPHGLAVTCQGNGQPTVILEAGLNTTGDTFAPLASRISETTRVCFYDRAGVGQSQPLLGTAPDPSAGSAARALRRALDDQGIRPPYVVSGWSYGGMVTQAFAGAYPDLVSGILLEDSAVPAELRAPFFADIDWVDGGRPVDEAATTRQLASVDFGNTPLVVLTQGTATGEFRRIWFGYSRNLARLSSDAVHVEALGSGHEIHEQAEDLQLALTLELVEAARTGDPLAACDRRFADVGGECF